MTHSKRIQKLIDHYRRVRDDRAGKLARTQARLFALRGELADAQNRRGELNDSLDTVAGGSVDVRLALLTQAYKVRLDAEIERRRGEVDEVEIQESKDRAETTEAFRRTKIWENVKEKTDHAEMEEAVLREQKELDDLAQKNRHRTRTHAPGGHPSGHKDRTRG